MLLLLKSLLLLYFIKYHFIYCLSLKTINCFIRQINCHAVKLSVKFGGVFGPIVQCNVSLQKTQHSQSFFKKSKNYA